MTKESSPRKLIFASLFTAILGLIDTAILTAQHYRIADQGLMQKSFCTLSSYIDCDTALASAYSHIGPIPSSELGFLFYLVIALSSLWALSAVNKQKAIFNCQWILTSGALAYSAYMAYILFGKLQVLCLFCVASYVLTIILFGLISAALAKTKANLGSLLTTDKRILASFIVLTTITYAVGILFFFGLNKKAHAGKPQFNPATLTKHFYSQAPVKAQLPKRPSWGPDDAAITIVDFSDFQCPFCKRAAFSLKPYLGEFRKDIRIVYMNFPLSSECNPNIEHNGHPMACVAAKAAYCTFKQQGNDAFWKFHDAIFEKQKDLTQTLITTTIPTELGMNPDTLQQCLVAPETANAISEDIRLGTETFKVQGTPSVYINGRFLRGWMEPSVLRTIIKAELARTKK